MNPPLQGHSDTKAALQALGKRIIENSTLYHFKSDGIGGGLNSTNNTNNNSNNNNTNNNVQLPPKKQKLDNTNNTTTNNAKGNDNSNTNHTTNHNNHNNHTNNINNINHVINNRAKDDGHGPYLTYEQYENLLYRGGKPPLMHLLQPKEHILDGDPNATTTTTTTTTMMNELPMDTLISNHLGYHPHHHPHPHPHHHMLSSSIPSTIDTSSLSSSLSPSLAATLSPAVTAALTASLHHGLTTIQNPNISSYSPSNQMLIQSPTNHSTIAHPIGLGTPTSAPSSPITSVPSPQSAPSTPPNTAHAVALLTNAENQKIQRKKANQQEREVLEKYYNEHYVDQSVKIRKEDLSELAFQLNWHVLRVQGWMHTHRQSRSDYNPPKRTKRRATLPQEQDILKHYFKVWTEQGLIDLHSPTRVTPKDYEMVAAALGWDNERVRRWTDHYKQKIKAASEGAP